MITFETGSTSESIDFAKENLSRLGNIERITHERKREEVFYKTTFYGSSNTMTIIGGLASGYGGEGPSGLADLLKEIGVDETVVKEEIYGNSEENYSFEITL